jgi:hypothetical protein
MQDITPAITVEVDRQPLVGPGHELHLAEGARPGPEEAVAIDIPFLDYS